jgi:NADPH-dependent 2,4-dienoyl-CoA reductase/sulfur reductase-like enzyme
MNELGQILSQPQRPARKVVILGGDRIGCLAAEGLSRQGVKVKLIESNPEQARELASRLDNVEIIVAAVPTGISWPNWESFQPMPTSPPL